MSFDPDSFMALVQPVLDHPPLLILALITGTLISEDATTVGAALLVSAEKLDPLLGFASVNGGILLGDMGLYGAGALAARWPRLSPLLRRPRVQQARRWLDGNLVALLLATRFTPGTRLPTYVACGALNMPFLLFCVVLALAALGWTGAVFGIVMTAGTQVMAALGPWKWLGGLVIFAVLVVLPRLAGPWVARWFGVRLPLSPEQER